MDPWTGRRRRAAATAILGAVLACGAPPAASAQPPPAEARVFVTASVGLARTGDATFRDVYGRTLVPASVQVDWRLGKAGVQAIAGVRHVSQSGEGIGGTPLSSRLPLRFAMTSMRFGIGWRTPGRRWRVAVSGAGSYNWYRETWEDLDVETRDHVLGVTAQASVWYRVSRRVSLIAGAEFSAIGVDPKDPALPSVSLGSVDLLGGLSVGFWH